MLVGSMAGITFSPQFEELLQELETGAGHLFITGKAGTGKSTILQQFRLRTKIPLVVLAPTGVAAVHISGETIHSFFKFAPNVTKKEARSDAYFCEDRTLYKKLQMIIIDEISMVRSDLLDCVDTFLRVVRDDERSFGGVRMVFFGDLYQLPPVVTSNEYMTFRSLYQSEWFFDSQVMQDILMNESTRFSLVELTTIYRQRDPAFIDLLGRIRMNTVEESHIRKLNERVIQNNPGPSADGQDDKTVPPIEIVWADSEKKGKSVKKERSSPPAITLTARRDTAQQINQEHLAKLRGKEHLYDGTHTGSFPDGHLPTGTQLALKVGARVMFVANDPEGRFVNGTLGTVKKCHVKSVTVAIDGGHEEVIEPHTWELSHTVLSDSGELKKEKLGDFTQLPLMLAWAVTIHKSQGKTFDAVHINLEKGAFAHGQVYVALSRATSFEGISLTHPITAKDIRMNWRVNQFLTQYAMHQANIDQPREEKFQKIQDALEMGTAVTITYLQKNGEMSTYTVQPQRLEEMTYQGKPFVGLKALSQESMSLLTFNAERIVKVE